MKAMVNSNASLLTVIYTVNTHVLGSLHGTAHRRNMRKTNEKYRRTVQQAAWATIITKP